MNYKLISGIIQELEITKGYEDLLFTKAEKDAVGIVAIGATLLGNGSSAAVLSSSISGAEVDMEFFTCKIEGIQLKGRFHRVGFSNGEKIDFVVELKDGIAEVQCARNSIRRLIWTLPYQMRGHRAQKKSDIRKSILISGALAIVACILTFRNSSLTGDKLITEILWLLIPLFLIGITVNFLSRSPFYKFSLNATEIFRILQFKRPELVNLPKYHQRAERQYSKETGDPYEWEIPWRYRFQNDL